MPSTLVQEQAPPQEWLHHSVDLVPGYINEIQKEIDELQSDIATLQKWIDYAKSLQG